ncbi:MAG: phosphotransferase [Rhizomicrobium sp.]|jgi:aminoglycoside/choline kinase family phosphotransferase
MTDRAEAMHDFLKSAGWDGAELSPLPGDASTRRYVRAALNSRKAMVMDQPQGAETPACPPGATAEQRRAMGYNAIARLAGADIGRFVATAEFLRARGLSAPQIYAADTKDGFALIEDLGDGLYADVLAQGGDEHALYGTAIDALATIHAEAAPALLPSDKPLHAFDDVALVAETDLMTEWFVPVALGRNASEAEVSEHRALWRAALAPVLASPSVFVHRDYHAQNLIWLPERMGIARAGMIDFQDAVAGTRSYDLISLVEDARRDVAPALAEAMTARYLDAMRAQGRPLDADAYRAEMAVMAAQRNAKIAGIFARLYKRDGKPRYLSYLPRVWGYLNRDLEHPALTPLKAWYERVIPRAVRGNPMRGGSSA